mgnify:CR=1 FL=1
MDLIETFGAKVGALSEAKPEKARKLLAAGFQANGLKNKLASKRASQSDKMLFQTVNKAMVNCLTKPWACTPTPARGFPATSPAPRPSSCTCTRPRTSASPPAYVPIIKSSSGRPRWG